MQASSTGVCAIDILLKQKSRQMDSRFDPHDFAGRRLQLDRPAMRSVRVDCASDRIDEADNGLWLSPLQLSTRSNVGSGQKQR
jgi:hypothetical protein